MTFSKRKLSENNEFGIKTHFQHNNRVLFIALRSLAVFFSFAAEILSSQTLRRNQTDTQWWRQMNRNSSEFLVIGILCVRENMLFFNHAESIINCHVISMNITYLFVIIV